MDEHLENAPAPAAPTGGGGARFGPPPAVVVLRPIGSPLSVGLAGLGIASLLESALALGWVPASQTSQVGLVLLVIPFVLQLLACVLSYLARDGASGAAVGVLATTWLAIGLLHLQSGTTKPEAAMGIMLLGAGGAVGISASTICRANLLAGTVFSLAALRFLIDGVFGLGAGTSWQHVAGVVGLVVVGLASYAVAAFELEGQARRPVLPTMRRAPGRPRTSEDGLGEIAREAGVRGTS